MGYNKAGRQFAYTPQKGVEMMIWSKMFGLMLAGICLSTSALASGWTVTVSRSNESVSSATTFTVPFTINTTYYTTTPVTATVSTFPQIIFRTNASNPPVLVGDGSPGTPREPSQPPIVFLERRVTASSWWLLPSYRVGDRLTGKGSSQRGPRMFSGAEAVLFEAAP